MKIKTPRFGQIAIQEASIINFEPGIMAFEHLNRFILLDIGENPNFKWLQSIDDLEVTFLLVDPFRIKNDYYIELSDEMVQKLDISIPQDVLVYTIVTVPESGLKNATTNLVGPLIINWTMKKAKQIIFENENSMIKYPLFTNYSENLSNGG